jgi:hemolysin type calcium-binding protein
MAPRALASGLSGRWCLCLRAPRHADVILGGAGSDRIRAGGGDDLVCAGSTSDR